MLSFREKRALVCLHGWFFDRMILVLNNGEWKIKIKDFSKFRSVGLRSSSGLTEPDMAEEGGIICLDRKRGGIRVLVHELGHVFFDDWLKEEARQSPSSTYRKLKGKNKFERWNEIRILEFERYFFDSLSQPQKRTLQSFVDKAKKT